MTTQPMPPQALVRLAGGLYFAIIATSFASLALVDARLSGPDVRTTADNLAQHATLARAGLVYDLLMYATVAVLAWSLFEILRGVDASIARLGLVMRLVESALGAGAVAWGFLALHAASSDPELVAAARATRDAVTQGVLVFLSLGTLAFCWLLWRSRYVPRWLSGLGIVSFTVMLVGAPLALLEPSWASALQITWAPGVGFEAGLGLWLLIRGFRVQRSVRSARPKDD